MSEDKIEKHISPGLKLVLEVGPVVLFVLAYNFGAPYAVMLGLPEAVQKPIFLGTLVLMILTPLSIAVSWFITRTVPAMPVVTLVIVMVFGAIAIYTQDAFYKKVQPTIVNLLFSSLLLGGLLFGKSVLRMVMDTAFDLDDEGWAKLTWRWGVFFLFMAGVNEVVWRNFSEEFWVSFKLWGMSGLTMAFVISQMPVMMKHAIEDGGDGDKPRE
ncbi:MAG: septation protein A [Pseudomonadota bacterium]